MSSSSGAGWPPPVDSYGTGGSSWDDDSYSQHTLNENEVARVVQAAEYLRQNNSEVTAANIFLQTHIDSNRVQAFLNAQQSQQARPARPQLEPLRTEFSETDSAREGGLPKDWALEGDVITSPEGGEYPRSDRATLVRIHEDAMKADYTTSAQASKALGYNPKYLRQVASDAKAVPKLPAEWGVNDEQLTDPEGNSYPLSKIPPETLAKLAHAAKKKDSGTDLTRASKAIGKSFAYLSKLAIDDKRTGKLPAGWGVRGDQLTDGEGNSYPLSQIPPEILAKLVQDAQKKDSGTDLTRTSKAIGKGPDYLRHIARFAKEEGKLPPNWALVGDELKSPGGHKYPKTDPATLTRLHRAAMKDRDTTSDSASIALGQNASYLSRVAGREQAGKLPRNWALVGDKLESPGKHKYPKTDPATLNRLYDVVDEDLDTTFTDASRALGRSDNYLSHWPKTERAKAARQSSNLSTNKRARDEAGDEAGSKRPRGSASASEFKSEPRSPSPLVVPPDDTETWHEVEGTTQTSTRYAQATRTRMELGADDRFTEVPISYDWQGALSAKHPREYNPGADHEFPLRDVRNPVGRVDARYADPATGGVAPNVGVESVRPAMGSRQLIQHLSTAGVTISPADLNRSMALLNADIQNEMERLIGNSRGQQRVRQPLIQGVRLSNNDPSLEEHERAALAGQWDLRVVAPSNGLPLQFLGIYAGSLMRSDADVGYLERNEPEHSRYALQASSSFRRQPASYGTAAYGNSTALANAALRPLSETGGIPEYDEARINSMFLEFDVRLTGANGKSYTETIAVLVGLPNLFGPNNPHRRVLVSLRESFLDQIQNEMQPSSSDRARRAERRQRPATPPIKEEQQPPGQA